jgi:hypothetical protein
VDEDPSSFAPSLSISCFLGFGPVFPVFLTDTLPGEKRDPTQRNSQERAKERKKNGEAKSGGRDCWEEGPLVGTRGGGDLDGRDFGPKVLQKIINREKRERG